ncbi:MAG: LptF/LptG family permease [Bacteriovoracales bacterium]|nr:LptF/LptG family permease [Bacteriovoracales bacterium]
MNFFGKTLLQKLIWKEWLKAFSVAFFSLFLLFTVGELITQFSRTSIPTSDIMINYFLSMPYYLSHIIPISCLMATLFSLHSLRSRNELVAVLALGLSRKKLIFYILQIASLITALQFINVVYLDPSFKKLHKMMVTDRNKKFKQKNHKSLLSSILGHGQIWYRSKKYYVSYLAYDKNKKTLIKPTFFYFNENNESTKIIKAEQALGNETHTWSLSNVQIAKDLEGPRFPELENRDTLQLSLEESPLDFDRIDNDLSALGPIALLKFVSQIKKSGILSNEYEIFLFKKISTTIICLLFALLPMGIIYSPNQRNSSFGKNILITLGLLATHWSVHNIFLELGNSAKIPPLIAVFATPALWGLVISRFVTSSRSL